MKRRDFLIATAGTALVTSRSPAAASEAGKEVRIAAFQGHCSDDVDRNLDRVLEIMEACGRQSTDFLCFPEGYLSNYSDKLALSLDDSRIDQLLRYSRKNDTVSIVGLSELSDGKVFNSALIIHQGRILGKYRKTMLTGSDKKIFAADYSLPTFEAKGIPFGVIICHDSSFVEPALTMRCKGARLLFSPHYNSIDSDRMDEHRTKVRNTHVGLSCLLQMVVVRSNVIGWENGKLGYGDSAIFSPLGVPVATAPLFKEALIFAEFDRSVFEGEVWASRDQLPIEVIDQLDKAERESLAAT